MSSSWRTMRVCKSGLQPISAEFSLMNTCRKCMRSRFRPFSSSSNRSSSSTSSSSGVARLTSRRILSVAGPDAPKFLQGSITSNVLPRPNQKQKNPSEAPRDTFYSGFLSAQGRVLHDVFVYRDTTGPHKNEEGAYLIEVDAAEATTLAKHIRRYKLRAKFDVRLLDEGEMTVWHSWGVSADGISDKAILHRDTRAPDMGFRYVSPSDIVPVQTDIVDEKAYRIHRYLLGVAEGQKELLRGTALPLESNMDLMGGIDYHKGCYVGQELTIRTKHRGVVRKRILPCIVYEDGVDAPSSLVYDDQGPAAALPAEASISRAAKKGRSTGKWLAGVGNLGLALCRLETMTDIVLPGEAAAATPFDPTSEFVVKNEVVTEEGSSSSSSQPAPVVKIKAFVPDWLRQGLTPEE